VDLTTLSREQAQSLYDRIGARQDSQAFYDDPATEFLISHGDFGCANRVFEFGCGTGRFALRLISEHLPETACYRGVDLSSTMVGALLCALGGRDCGAPQGLLCLTA
jgi:SAM-dependent methyltransferase